MQRLNKPFVMQEYLRDMVELLCSKECAGREAGSPEGRRAAAIIRAEFERAGFQTEAQRVPGCRGINIIANKNQCSEHTILVAAHYDHLGREMAEEAYWGADDNAAGVAIVLALAHTLGQRSADEQKNFLFVAFDGEEPPHFLSSEMGSVEFVAKQTFPTHDIEIAIVMDLVGHDLGPKKGSPSLRNSLFALGAEKSMHCTEHLQEAARQTRGLSIRELDLDLLPPLSDYEAFRRVDVPVLFLTAGRWRHYHRITDTPEKLSYDKMKATHDFLVHFCTRLKNAPTPIGRYTKSRRNLRGSLDSLRELAQLATEDHLLPPDYAKTVSEITPDDAQAIQLALLELETELA